MKYLSRSILPLLLGLPMFVSGAEPLYLDPAEPIGKRVDDLIPRLTLPEKASLLGTTAPAIERLKIPVMNGWNQSLHGIVWTSNDHVSGQYCHGCHVGSDFHPRCCCRDRR